MKRLFNILILLIFINRICYSHEKEKSDIDSCYNIYNPIMEKLVCDFFNRDIAYELFSKGKIITIFFYVWPNDTFSLMRISFDTTLFTKTEISNLENYIKDKATLKYCFCEKGFPGETHKENPILYNVIIPCPKTSLRFKENKIK